MKGRGGMERGGGGGGRGGELLHLTAARRSMNWLKVTLLREPSVSHTMHLNRERGEERSLKRYPCTLFDTQSVFETNNDDGTVNRARRNQEGEETSNC